MDFSGQFHHHDAAAHHVHGRHQDGLGPYPPFLPLTPSRSAVDDDFHTASPPDAFDGIPAFDFAQQAFASTPGFPGPPTPPNASAAFARQHHQQPPHRQPPPPPPPPPPQLQLPHQLQQHQPSPHRRQPLPRTAGVNGLASGGAKADAGYDDMPPAQRGSDEDDALTPAQSRRKAQNRAAQRAFRERKEKHVKDLEAKLASLEAAQHRASVENERLKRDLQKMSTENEILRATSGIGSGHNSHSPEPTTAGPMQYNPSEFYANVLQHHQDKLPSHRITTSDNGERLLAAGATWDFIISHDLYKRGLVDVGDVSDRLKNLARCDGQGPVFAESAIVAAMEQSVTSGSDDLL